MHWVGHPVTFNNTSLNGLTGEIGNMSAVAETSF